MCLVCKNTRAREKQSIIHQKVCIVQEEKSLCRTTKVKYKQAVKLFPLAVAKSSNSKNLCTIDRCHNLNYVSLVGDSGSAKPKIF